MTDILTNLRHLLESYESSASPDHWKVAVLLSVLSDTLAAAGKFPEAEQNYWRALEIHSKFGDGNNVAVAQTLQDIAKLNEQQHNQMEAERLYRWAYDIKSGHFSIDSPELNKITAAILHCMQEQGKEIEQEEMLLRERAIKKSDSKTEQFPWNAYLSRVETLFNEGRPGEAESILIYLHDVCTVFAPETSRHAEILNILARMLQMSQRFDEAKLVYEKSLAMLEKLFGNTHDSVALCLENMADLHLAAADLEQAKLLYNWSASTFHQSSGPDSESYLRIKDKLAKINDPAALSLNQASKEAQPAANLKQETTAPSLDQTPAPAAKAQAGMPAVPDFMMPVDSFKTDEAISEAADSSAPPPAPPAPETAPAMAASTDAEGGFFSALNDFSFGSLGEDSSSASATQEQNLQAAPVAPPAIPEPPPAETIPQNTTQNAPQSPAFALPNMRREPKRIEKPQPDKQTQAAEIAINPAQVDPFAESRLKEQAVAQQVETLDDRVSIFLWEKYIIAGKKAMERKQLDEAERLFSVAVEKANLFGFQDEKLWQSLCYMGSVFEATHKYVKAEQLFKQSLGLCEKYLGGDNPECAPYWHNLGSLYEAMREYPAAMACFDREIVLLSKKADAENTIKTLQARITSIKAKGK